MSDSAKMLQSYVERIERLEEEKRALAGDIREIYAEAKAKGFDPKIMRKVIAERRRNVADVEEEQALIDTYKVSLGMLRDTPLGDAAMRAAKKVRAPVCITCGKAVEDTGYACALCTPSNDHGRAAPRAAGNDAGASSPSAPAEVSARPVASPASPDPSPAPAESQRDASAPDVGGAGQRIIDGMTEAVACAKGEMQPVRVTTFPARVTTDGNNTLADEPPDIPPFLDRRQKQADIEDYTKAAAE